MEIVEQFLGEILDNEFGIQPDVGRLQWVVLLSESWADFSVWANYAIVDNIGICWLKKRNTELRSVNDGFSVDFGSLFGVQNSECNSSSWFWCSLLFQQENNWPHGMELLKWSEEALRKGRTALGFRLDEYEQRTAENTDPTSHGGKKDIFKRWSPNAIPWEPDKSGQNKWECEN